jgi:molybdopterin-binding protein
MSEAASLLGISDDTIRRLVNNAEVGTHDDSGRQVVEGVDLVKIARERAPHINDPTHVGRSARNRFVGLVTDIKSDGVMAQVEMQCGPNRVVSLMSTEAIGELSLQLGDVAVAVVKSTTVIIETPAE